jgi:hypothetical protein
MRDVRTIPLATVLQKKRRLFDRISVIKLMRARILYCQVMSMSVQVSTAIPSESSIYMIQDLANTSQHIQFTPGARGLKQINFFNHNGELKDK